MAYDNYGGYVVYEPSNPNKRYYFDKSVNQMDSTTYELRNSRVQLDTFGRVPFVYYGGNTNYQVIRLENVFVEGLCQDGEKITDSARKQVNDFKKLLEKRVPLILENSQGEGYVVDIYIEREETPKTHHTGENLLDYIQIVIVCTEIGRLYNKIKIKHIGTGGGETSVSQ